MKVKMLRSPSTSFGCNLTEGQIGAVDGYVGKLLVDANIAVEIAEPKEVKAIPEKPAIAESKPATIATSKPSTEVEAKPKPKKPSTEAEAKPKPAATEATGPTTSKPSSGKTFTKKES